jgi:hypothetical protein
MSQRAVGVLGMHRSGTSAITSLLEPIGVHLGALDDLRDDAAGDPHGYWEHRGLKAVSEDLLHRLGADWHRPPIVGDGWHKAASLDDLRAHARRVIAAHAGDHPLWGWKDPRTSITLPFWKPLLPGARYVVCLRHPLEAARSLETRDALPLWHGLRLWLHYTASALIHTAGEPRLLLFYEDALADPVAAMEAIAALVDRPAPPADEAIRRVTPDRRHQRVAPIAADGECPDAVRALFAVLRAVVGPGGLRTASAGAILDATASAALAAQRADDQVNGVDGWQARPPAGEPAPSIADAWDRVRRTLGSR